MNSTDADLPAKRAPGRPRRSFTRPALNLRVEPELRARIVAMAEESGRSITQETEALLQHALNGGAKPEVPASADTVQRRPRDRARGADQSLLQWLLPTLAKEFGSQLAGLICMMAYAMLFAELDSIAWSWDVAERTRRFPAVKGRTRLPQRQLTELWDFLHQSSPAHKAEQYWLSDPYVFGQVADAARHVIEILAPQGDPSPPRPPRGINPAEAADLMEHLGENAASWAVGQLTADKPAPAMRRGVNEPAMRRAINRVGKADRTRLRQCLGELPFARLKQQLADAGWEWPEPTDGETESPAE